MKIRFSLILAVFCACSALSISAFVVADEIYSSLGPSGEFYTENGWSITFEPGYGGQAVAFSFVPAFDAILESVELPIGIEWLPDGASTEFSVGIYEDAAGAPGSLLTSASGTASFYWNNPQLELIQVDFPDAIDLYSGMRYWVGVHPKDPVPTYLGWSWRYQALEAPMVEFWGVFTLSELLVGGTFDYLETNYEAAFRVNGLASKKSGKKEKLFVCHVGNEAGPNGETYLDDPGCVPNELNSYFCPDAGKIDLIFVAEKAAANHLNNPSHSWDGISDFLPADIGATGKGAQDRDGNGIDDGCEPAL